MIVMCFNSKEPYVTQAEVALKSIEMNSPGMPVSLYLIDFDSHSFTADRCIDVQLNNRKLITAYSLVAMYNTLLECKTRILWLDSDVIVRANLQNIFSDVQPNTLKIMKRKTPYPYSIFNTGVVAMGYSEETLALLKDASEQAMHNPVWFSDQASLYDAYKKHHARINFVNLGKQKKWHDIGGRELADAFCKNSAIWHCKSIHSDNPKYKKEYEHYKGLLNEDSI